MPWYLHLALKQLFPTGKSWPFFTLISVLGVALGVTLLMVSTGVMGGFGREIRRMIVETQGDVQVRAPGLLRYADRLADELEALPAVVGAAPFAEGVVMLEHDRKPTYPMIRGVDVERINRVIPLDRYVRVGSLEDLDDDGVILSAELAHSIGARLGAKVQVFSPLVLEQMKRDEIMLPRELEVVGLLQIGHQELDSSVAIVTLRRMQELYGLGEEVHGIQLKLRPGLDPDLGAREINAVLGDLAPRAVARSWMDTNQEFLFVLQLEKNLIFFLLVFIVVVAAFSVMSSLLIAVVRKTREIGLLGAMGARPWQVAACFCAQGLLIGVVGTVVGLGLGAGALYFRNDLVRTFTQLTGSEEALVRFYQFSNLPAHLSRSDITLIVACTIIIATLAGMIPAWRAARLKPVEALRSE